MTYREVEAELKWPLGTMFEIDQWWVNQYKKFQSAIVIVTEYKEEGGFAGDEYEGWIEGDLIMMVYAPKSMEYYEFDLEDLEKMFKDNAARIIHKGNSNV